MKTLAYTGFHFCFYAKLPFTTGVFEIEVLFIGELFALQFFNFLCVYLFNCKSKDNFYVLFRLMLCFHLFPVQPDDGKQ